MKRLLKRNLSVSYTHLVQQKAFDFEEDGEGVMVPHYYKEIEGSEITKFSTTMISEAIKRYQL